MKTWKITNAGTLERTNEPAESPSAGQVKIKIEATLVSRSDLLIFDGKLSAPLPIVPGCSCVGMVTEVGEGVTMLERGSRVYVAPNKTCGKCTACKSGNASACENISRFGITTNGFLRDFAVLDEDVCVTLPERLSATEAVFLDYVAIAIKTLDVMGVGKGDYFIISGASTLGILLGQVAMHAQAVPIIIDSEQEYLNVASACGIYYTVNSSEMNPYEKIFHITGGKMAECVAHLAIGQTSLAQTVELVGAGGKLAIVGRYGSASSADLTCSLAPLVEKRATIVCLDGSVQNFSSAINLLATKEINVLPLVEKDVTSDDVPQVFERFVHSFSPLKDIIKC